MRRIFGLLKDIRQHQLSKLGEPNARIAEAGALFDYMDGQMNGIRMDAPNAVLQETLVSADFTYAIMEFVNRLAIPGYQKKNFAFESLVWPDTLTNFLPHNRYQNRGGFDDLEYVGQKGQARPGSIDDATKRVHSAYRWEKQIDIAYETLVNDDLAYLEDTVRLMGEAARRTLEKYVSRMYTNATSIARLVALGALYAQNGRLTTARVSEARMAFNQRTNARAEPINARGVLLVIHSGLVDTAQQILRSTQVAELMTNAVNVVTFTTIEDPYIAGAAPNLPWYFFTDWRTNNIRPFVLARLQGWTGPRVYRKRSDMEAVTSLTGAGAMVLPVLGDFDTGNIALKIVDVFGTYIDGTEGNLWDHRGAYYSTGTAP